MNKQLKRPHSLAGAILAVCTASALIALPAGAQTGTATAPDASKSSSGMSGEMGQAMMRNMQQMQSMPMSGDTDRDFAMMMRMHHQGGIDMAQAELKSGRDPKMRDMAKKIIATQQKEIKEFDTWLAKHKDGASHNAAHK